MAELAASRAAVGAALEAAAAAARAEGMPVPPMRGQLIRPLIACAGGVPPAGDRFWYGALAIQLAHEASLVHDDIIDGTDRRRGAPTPNAAAGVARALVLGDHLLTTAYRVASWTGSIEFVRLFAQAVERTVAGEIRQGSAGGRALGWGEYEAIVIGKSGELMGAALALGASLEGADDAEEVYALGRRIGLVYQMLDDLLDYAPATDTGKPALGDHAQRRWTWVLDGVDGAIELPVAAVLEALYGGGAVPARRALERFDAEADSLGADLAARLGRATPVLALLEEWRARAHEAVEREIAARAVRAAPAVARTLADRVPALRAGERFMAVNSRSFRFATRFFPRAEAERVMRVYAFCRVTDDLVDEPSATGGDPEAVLGEWLELSRRAYAGAPSGMRLLDEVMREMADAEVPFELAEALVEGMRMDLEAVRYANHAELRRYTYCVASVVGLWVSRLFGVRDAQVLDRASAMGHAMQLTNILRDVGEDWARGRLYLPADRMRYFGVTEADISELCAGRRGVTPAYRALTEELIGVAETAYRDAFPAIASLPRTLQRPVAVASHVYRGIHQEIRRRGHDNLRARAYTPGPRKLALAGSALVELWRLNRAASRAGSPLETLRAPRTDAEPALTLTSTVVPAGSSSGARRT